MNNLPKVVTQLCPEQDLNPRPVDRKSNALPVAPPRYHNVAKQKRHRMVQNSVIPLLCNITNYNTHYRKQNARKIGLCTLQPAT